MWSISFLMGMMFSLGVNASSCNIENVEGIVALLKESPQEKHYRNTNGQLLNLRYEEAVRGVRPELELSFNVDKDNSKNKEIAAKLLFSVNDYLKQGSLKKISGLNRDLRQVEFDRNYHERSLQVGQALFKLSQNRFFNDKVRDLIETLKSSESVYQTRPIKSREDEIILSSLAMLKSNLMLRKNKIESDIEENQLNLKKMGVESCEIDYKVFTNIINNLSFSDQGDERLLSLKELKLKQELIANSADYESRRFFENLRIGPSLSKERTDAASEYKIGVVLSFDLPTFSHTNPNYISKSRELALLEEQRSAVEAEFEKNILIQHFSKNSRALLSLPSFEKLEANIKKIKRSFDAGVISPLTYLDSYRSYLDFLDVSEELRLSVFESYIKLRGLYVENNNY